MSEFSVYRDDNDTITLPRAVVWKLLAAPVPDSHHANGQVLYGSWGMTLRDYFAAKAIPSVYATAMREAEQGSGLFQDEHWRIGLAADAYALADAMLAAREVKP